MVPTDESLVTVFSYSGPFVFQLWPEAQALRLRMSAARRHRYDKQQDATQRALQVAALRLLELGMRHCGYADFRLIDVVSVAGQKPHWPQAHVDFSLSHTAGLVVCAIARDARVGIDIEQAGVVAPRTLKRLMSPSAEMLPPLSTSNATARWTQVEAVVKAAGVGVFRALDIEWEAQQSRCAMLNETRWWWQSVDVGERYVAHVATDVMAVATEVVRVVDL